jgi:predicted transcriptional regulator
VERFTDLDLLEELQTYAPPGLSIRKPGGITSADWAEQQNTSRRTARKQLNKMVEDGLLIKERCKTETGSEYVYYRT